MDKKALVGKLNNIFCQLGKEGKKYSEVWLEETDFGGLYMSNKFTLNIRALHQINDCGEEIKDIVFLLYDKANEEYSHIFEVVVYGADDNIHCQSNEMMVYEDSKSCT
ncbi:MAG TPA: hypothetical protein VK666_02825 [Chryseolinea sp.]|nr:hypothetical protein [Chryseolinea sp.]